MKQKKIDTTEKLRVVSFRIDLPEDKHSTLKSISKSSKFTMTALVRMAIDDFIKKIRG